MRPTQDDFDHVRQRGSLEGFSTSETMKKIRISANFAGR
jgi:hypothetical protein